MSNDTPKLDRCPKCGRIFSIPAGDGVALCDRFLCNRAALEPASAESFAPGAPPPEPALMVRRECQLVLFEDIDAARRVLIGHAGSGSYDVCFENEGEETWLRLSAEAIEALHRVYLRVNQEATKWSKETGK